MKNIHYHADLCYIWKKKKKTVGGDEFMKKRKKRFRVFNHVCCDISLIHAGGFSSLIIDFFVQ